MISNNNIIGSYLYKKLNFSLNKISNSIGPKGYIGSSGDTGGNGSNGPAGFIGTIGAVGAVGAKGPDGPTGSIGLTGFVGSIGSTGAEGTSSSSSSSVFVWSSDSQDRILPLNQFQYVTFNQQISGPIGNGWTTSTRSGYSNPTNFIVPETGTYQISYKLDVSPGNSGVQSNSSVLIVAPNDTSNGLEIPGSSTIVKAPPTNHLYTILNTVLVNLTQGQSVSLLFWGSDSSSVIGRTNYLDSITLPNGGGSVTEAPVSLVFTRIST